MNGPPGSTIAQCPQDRRSTRGVLSRYSPRGQCSDDLESSSPSTKPGQLHSPLEVIGGMVTVTLHDVVALFASRDFWVNFLGNLGGALVGVWLAFWIERRRSRRDADRLYGHMLVSARSELAYLRPICVSIRDRLKAGGNA